MDIRLEHIDPARNMYRYYEVGIEPNLLGDHSVVIRWGRIGKPCRVRIHQSGPLANVASEAQKIIASKQNKGYSTCRDMILSGNPAQSRGIQTSREILEME